MIDGTLMMAFDGNAVPSAQCHGRDPGVWEEAHRQFQRSRRDRGIKRWWERLTGSVSNLSSLSAATSQLTVNTRYELGLGSVAIASIVGSEGRSCDFDSAFHPMQTHSKSRWVRIAAAHLCGDTLPPVLLIKVGEKYYVRDGHHRISVSRALGRTDIDAQVIVWHVSAQADDSKDRKRALAATA